MKSVILVLQKKTNIPLRLKKKTLFISIFITLITGLRDQIVKYTGKHREDNTHVLRKLCHLENTFVYKEKVARHIRILILQYLRVMFSNTRSAGNMPITIPLIKMTTINIIIIFFHSVKFGYLLISPGNKPQMCNIADVTVWSKQVTTIQYFCPTGSQSYW
jgi:hypothetical protein